LFIKTEVYAPFMWNSKDYARIMKNGNYEQNYVSVTRGCVTSDDQLVNSDQSDVTRQPLRSSKRLSDRKKSENQVPTAPTSPVGCHDVMKHRWQCKQCDKHFNLRRGLLLHVRSIHKTVMNQSAELVFSGKHLAVQQRGESALHWEWKRRFNVCNNGCDLSWKSSRYDTKLKIPVLVVVINEHVVRMKWILL